jgi:hypothetical protein
LAQPVTTARPTTWLVVFLWATGKPADIKKSVETIESCW